MSDMTPPITTAELEELELLLRRVPPLPWVWQNGCSFWRLASAVTGKDGDVLNPTRDHDGHPNLSTAYGVQDFIVKLANLAPRLLTAARQQPPAPTRPAYMLKSDDDGCYSIVGPTIVRGLWTAGMQEDARQWVVCLNVAYWAGYCAAQQPPAHEQGGEELRAEVRAWRKALESGALQKTPAQISRNFHAEDCEDALKAARLATDATGILSRPTQGGGGKGAYGCYVQHPFNPRNYPKLWGWLVIDQNQMQAQAASRGGEVDNG